MKITAQEVAKLVGGKLTSGPPERILTNFGALEDSGPEDLSFFGNAKYADAFRKTAAGAVLIPADCEISPETRAALIAVENPVMAFDVVVREFGIEPAEIQPGVDPTASVAADAQFDETAVEISAGAVVENGVEIGPGTWIGPNSTIGRNSTIGADCQIHALVALREGSVLGDRVILHSGVVIGADGYGYEFANGRHEKIRQAGIVELHDDVEVGANTTIDRARFGSTVIGAGTKIDNQVQIGHNVKIGKHCLVVAQVGISGSARIGDGVVLAAQTGVAGHINVADRTTLGGRSGVIANIDEPGGTYFGYPAKPMKETLRREMHQKKIPALIKRIAELEARLAEMDAKK